MDDDDDDDTTSLADRGGETTRDTALEADADIPEGETPAQAQEAIQDALLTGLDEDLVDKSDPNNICIYANPDDKTNKKPVVKITTAAGATKVTITDVKKLTDDTAKVVANTRPGFLITKGSKKNIIDLIDKFKGNAHKIKLDYAKLGLDENDPDIKAAFDRNPPVARARP